MPLKKPVLRRSFLRTSHKIASCAVLFFLCIGGAAAQTAKTLVEIKKVYVEQFGEENGAAKLRDATIEQLRRKAKLEIVPAPQQADAIVKGNGSIWVTGYISSDLRSPSNTRQPVFHGFLSVEIIGKDGEPLWSYLVTPSKVRAGDITKDLAVNLVAKFLEVRSRNEAAQTATVADSTKQVSLKAAGATFPAPLYQKWFESFHERHQNVDIKYSAVGSEAGLQQLMEGKVDFAASDMPLSDERMTQSKKTFLHFASVIGAVVPVYNLSDLDRNLNFTGEVLAGIYLGKIKKWDDAAIRGINRGVALPDADIVAVHRSDGSGTTFVWSEYLSKLIPEWKTSVGADTLVRWPVGTGAEGNEGVAAMVQRTPNSMGYVELVYALRHHLSFGAVRNAAGQFIAADLPSVTDAATDASATMKPDFRVSITNATRKDAYPIASFTWWLLPKEPGSDDKAAVFREVLQWMLSSGQKECSALGYAPLPREVVNQQLQALDKLK